VLSDHVLLYPILGLAARSFWLLAKPGACLTRWSHRLVQSTSKAQFHSKSHRSPIARSTGVSHYTVGFIWQHKLAEKFMKYATNLRHSALGSVYNRRRDQIGPRALQKDAQVERFSRRGLICQRLHGGPRSSVTRGIHENYKATAREATAVISSKEQRCSDPV
jgi:hypothetical protein